MTSIRNAEKLIGTQVKVEVQETPHGRYLRVNDPEFEAKLKASHERVRIIPPKSMVTMDFRPTRLNVYLDDNGVVSGVKFG